MQAGQVEGRCLALFHSVHGRSQRARTGSAHGRPRGAAQLNREGHPRSVGLVADLMHGAGLRACQPRAYKRTTIPGQPPVSRPDLIGRDFTAEAPGTGMVGDITYLKSGEGRLYLPPSSIWPPAW